MKQGLNISDDELRNNRKFSQVRERLRLEACGWGASERDKNLKARYWNAPQFVYSDLKICWDYRPLANRLNWEAPDETLQNCSLYECQAAQLFSLLSHSQNYQFDRVFQKAEENLLLRVVGHWERGTPLTPPILKLMEDGKLGKIDGFHRLAVAFAAKVSRVPFWSFLPLRMIQEHRITLLFQQTAEITG
jgi:hypothetical protein